MITIRKQQHTNNNHWWKLPNNSVKCSWFSMILHNHIFKCTLYIVENYVIQYIQYECSTIFWRFSFCSMAFCEFMSHIFINVSVVFRHSHSNILLCHKCYASLCNWDREWNWKGKCTVQPLNFVWKCGLTTNKLVFFPCLFWTSVLCLIICNIVHHTHLLFAMPGIRYVFDVPLGCLSPLVLLLFENVIQATVLFTIYHIIIYAVFRMTAYDTRYQSVNQSHSFTLFIKFLFQSVLCIVL